LQTVHNLAATETVDVWGNLLQSSIGAPANYLMTSYALGYEKYQLENFPCFIAGLAGVYNKRAIDCLMRHDGVPHIHTNNRDTAFVIERIHSFIMLADG